MECCVLATNVGTIHTLNGTFRSLPLVYQMVGIWHLPRMSINDIKMIDVVHILNVKQLRLLRTAWHVRRRKRRQRWFGKASLSPHFLILNMESGLIMKTQSMNLREDLATDPITIQVTGGSKDQWPPVGKSSDTPKEVKTQDGKDDHRSLGKPADMGRDVFICISAIPVICLKNHVQYVWNNFRKIRPIFVLYVIWIYNYTFIQG